MRLTLAAGTLLLSACAAPPPEAPPPPPSVTVSGDRVVLLPGSDGGSGSIVVKQDAKESVLDKPYTSARATTGGGLELSETDADAVKRDFAGALGALPMPAISLVLYFVSGQDDLTEDSLKQIGPLLEQMGRRPAPEITVIGHTDQTGSDRVNDPLSLKRAERVKEVLVKRGVPANRITVAGRGSREPLVRTPGGASELKNRRVEINIR